MWQETVKWADIFTKKDGKLMIFDCWFPTRWNPSPEENPLITDKIYVKVTDFLIFDEATFFLSTIMPEDPLLGSRIRIGNPKTGGLR